MTDVAFLRCIRPACAATSDLASDSFMCDRCGSLLDVAYQWDRLATPGHLGFFDERHQSRIEPIDFSGVWRFRELLPFAVPESLVTIGEGQTILHAADVRRIDLPLRSGQLYFQYEGLNPSGSFKDNGMAAAFTMARRLGRQRVACASTGNTSASLALYASLTRLSDDQPMQGIVFVGAGKIAYGKLSQALDYGALTLQIEGDFDACLKQIRDAAPRLKLYLMNSVNPFRLEGQKAIMYRVLEAMGWEVPDWIIVPGGNLGNSAAFGKAFIELQELGLVHRMPRLAIVNARGANTLFELVHTRGLTWNNGNWDDAIVVAHRNERAKAGLRARTIASAIEIADPVNLPKALRSLSALNGVVTDVSDEEILDEKARIGRSGFGCEPASAASLAGLRRLIREGTVDHDARVVCILTGHGLKDPDATASYHMGVKQLEQAETPGAPVRPHSNRPIRVANDLDAICRTIEEHS
ncbi:MAG: threonine synthase [Phycisphaerae bacterium]|nr:threonine synthase [Phycisphaerae bacterium]